MRLLILNYEYPPVGGGAGGASRNLARGLNRLGHEVCVITTAFGEERGLRNEDGVRVYRVAAGRRRPDRSSVGQMIRFAAAALLRARRVVRVERPEAVVAFFTLPSGLVGYWLRLRYDLPYVVSLRGGDVPGLVPELRYWHRLLGPLRRRILRLARHVVANAEGLAELSRAADPFPTTVIPNGVDRGTFRPGPATPSVDGESPFRILFVGRLTKQKNLGLLLDELARARREGMADFRLHVAGDGPLLGRLRRRSEDLGLDGVIVWHGWLGRSDLARLYREVDCFVSPSLYEGLPNAVLEAMACGLPVVASRVPGNDDLVADGRTGRLFALDRPGELAGCLQGLAADRAATRRMGEAARLLVESRPTWEEVGAAYVRLLE